MKEILELTESNTAVLGFITLRIYRYVYKQQNLNTYDALAEHELRHVLRSSENGQFSQEWYK